MFNVMNLDLIDNIILLKAVHHKELQYELAHSKSVYLISKSISVDYEHLQGDHRVNCRLTQPAVATLHNKSYYFVHGFAIASINT